MKQKNEPINSSLSPYLPQWVIWLGFTAWAVFALNNYFGREMAWPLWPFSMQGYTLNMSLFYSRFAEHLINIFYPLAIFISAFGVGSLLFRAFDAGKSGDEQHPESKLLALVLGLGALALITYAFGLLKLFYREVFYVLLFPFFVIGLARLAKTVKINVPRYTLLEKLAILLMVFAAACSLLGALTPEIFYDSQMYQLGVLNRWISDHRIFSDNLIPQSFFPFNVNMLYSLGMILNNEISAKLIHFMLGILDASLIYVFAKKYFNRKAAVFSALIFYCVPQVMTVSWKSAVELGITIFDLATVFTLVNFMVSKEKKWLWLAGIFCGFSVGAKYTSLSFCFLPALAMIVYSGISEKEKFWDIAKNLLFFSLLAFLVSAPWYIKNIILTGDPVFPMFWQKIGFARIRSEGSLFSDPPWPAFSFYNYFLFLWPLTMGGLQQEALPGAVFLTFIPLVFLFRNSDKKIKLLFSYFIFSLVLWAILARFYLRYFIQSLPVASLLLGSYIANIESKELFKKALLALLLALSLVNITYSNGLMNLIQEPIPYVLGQETKKEYLSRQRLSYPCPYFETLDYANKIADKNAKILFLGETRGLYCRKKYIINGPGDYSPFVEWTKSSKDAAELYKKVKDNGVTHILFNAPEMKRLRSLDMFYWDVKELKVFAEFWRKYVREAYIDIGDISLPNQGVFSMKNQKPLWWQKYSGDPKNYVYLYEILSKADSLKPHKAPENFLLENEFYSQERWEKIGPSAAQLKKYYD